MHPQGIASHAAHSKDDVFVAETKLTTRECTAIRDQLERMLQHQAFKNSKRCSALMRHLVEHALDNPSVHLKERTLGMEVFGRNASYDTSLDPVVRMTANEIRKRIAQYYHEHESDAETKTRIELPVGSYLPEFRFYTPPAPTVPEETILLTRPEEADSAVTNSKRILRRRRRLLYGSVGALAALIVAGILIYFLSIPSNFARFWSPAFSSPNRVLICIGTGAMPSLDQSRASTQNVDSGLSRPASSANQDAQAPPSQDASTNDVDAISKIVSLLVAKKKSYELRAASVSTLDDLRGGPVILVGIANNNWTRRLTSSLRFHIDDNQTTRVIRIVDANNPARRDWAVQMDQSLKDLKTDYAVVSRYTDSLTDTAVIEVAGMRSYGTIAAAEFVSNPRYMNEVKNIPSNCERNEQFVLQAQVIDGVPGPPRVVAMHCW
jgi:hypothetical protein